MLSLKKLTANALKTWQSPKRKFHLQQRLQHLELQTGHCVLRKYLIHHLLLFMTGQPLKPSKKVAPSEIQGRF